MKDGEMAAIRERWARATEGPWGYDANGFVRSGSAQIAQTWDKFEDDFGNALANGAAIAATPGDVATLLGAVERAEARHATLRAALCALVVRTRPADMGAWHDQLRAILDDDREQGG